MWYRTGILCGMLFVALGTAPLQADIDCDGVDDLLTTGLALSNFISASAFTVAAWVKVQSTPATEGHCYQGSVLTGEGDGNLSLGRLSPTEFCAEVYAPAQHLLTGAATAGWHHLALTLTGGTVTLAVDGIEEDSQTSGGTMGDLTSLMTLCGTPLAFTADRLADVRYYPTALPNADLQWLAHSRLRGAGRTPASAYWPLDDCPDGDSGNGVTFKDRSGNNRDATGASGGGTCRASTYLAWPWGIQ